jgi:hypothetical protein
MPGAHTTFEPFTPAKCSAGNRQSSVLNVPTGSTGPSRNCAFTHEHLYHKWRYLATGSGIRLWAKAAKARCFLPELKLLSVHT